MSADPSPPGGDLAAGLAATGPYFALDFHDPGSLAVAPWRPMRELVEGDAVLDARIAATRAALATSSGVGIDGVEARVAASVAHLGLSARLLAPVLAVAVSTRCVLDVDLERAWWQPVLGGPFPLSVPSLSVPSLSVPSLSVPPQGGTGIGWDRVVMELRLRVLDGPLTELVQAVRARSVSGQVLWGNVASALYGALALISTARPSDAVVARRLAAGLLDTGPLRGAGFTDSRGGFRRRSCCLIYRVDPARSARAICGDCVLGGT